MNQTQAIQSLGRTKGTVGDEVTVFTQYVDAQKAVDTLSDEGFPVENVQIVGHDLRLIENVTGRLTFGKAVLGGAASGVWLGALIGMIWVIIVGEFGALLWAAGLGALWGAAFGAIPYFMSRGTRDFTSTTSVVPNTFAIYCQTDKIAECRRILTEKGILRPSAPPVDLDEPPMYGERITPPAEA